MENDIYQVRKQPSISAHADQHLRGSKNLVQLQLWRHPKIMYKTIKCLLQPQVDRYLTVNLKFRFLSAFNRILVFTVGEPNNQTKKKSIDLQTGVDNIWMVKMQFWFKTTLGPNEYCWRLKKKTPGIVCTTKITHVLVCLSIMTDVHNIFPTTQFSAPRCPWELRISSSKTYFTAGDDKWYKYRAKYRRETCGAGVIK